MRGGLKHALKRSTKLAALVLAGALSCGLSGCDSKTTSGGAMDMAMPPAATDAFRGTLDVDIRYKVDVVITPGDHDAIDVQLHFQPGSYGVLDPSQPLEATGRIEHFPEADLDLYTATFSAPAVSGGMCGDQPVSLALSLARREGNDRVSGGLTGYCGEDVYAGTPARILRFAGSLPLVKAQ